MSEAFDSEAFGDLDAWRAGLNALLAGNDDMMLSVKASDLRGAFNTLFDTVNELDTQAQQLYECGLLLQTRLESQARHIAALGGQLDRKEE